MLAFIVMLLVMLVGGMMLAFGWSMDRNLPIGEIYFQVICLYLGGAILVLGGGCSVIVLVGSQIGRLLIS